MIKTKSQHFNFSREAIPVMFHSQTTDFFNYLERDGLKFLKFWWDHVGERLENENLVPFTGMNFEVRDIPERKAKAVIIKLPRPSDFEEFHYLVMFKKPNIRLPFIYVKLPSTRVFALAHVPLSQNENGTMIYEITPHGRVVPAGSGTKVAKEAFYAAAKKLVWKK